MKPIQVGEQYFTMWRTGLAGPFTYDGGTNYCFQSFITGDIMSLVLAQEGFTYMFERWTFDSKRGESLDQLADIMSDEAIDLEIAKATDAHVVMTLEGLRFNRSKILATVGR